jgi:hypothetical protein
MIINVVMRPIVVKALQWTGNNNEECKQFVGDNIKFIYPTMDLSVVWGVIRTFKGEITMAPGDYIIHGVDGEFYPCKKDIFERTYINVIDN